MTNKTSTKEVIILDIREVSLTKSIVSLSKINKLSEFDNLKTRAEPRGLNEFKVEINQISLEAKTSAKKKRL